MRHFRTVQAQRIRPHVFDLFRQFRRRPCKLAAHGRRQIDHLHALTLQTDLLQQLPGVFHAAAGVEITFQVMAVAFQSTRHHHAVGAILKSAQHV
jgi:hypothetical protein